LFAVAGLEPILCRVDTVVCKDKFVRTECGSGFISEYLSRFGVLVVSLKTNRFTLQTMALLLFEEIAEYAHTRQSGNLTRVVHYYPPAFLKFAKSESELAMRVVLFAGKRPAS